MTESMMLFEATIPAISVENRRVYYAMKRVLDITVSLLALVLIAPLLLAIASVSGNWLPDRQTFKHV